MDLLNLIKDNYNNNVPILINDIRLLCKDYSNIRVAQLLKELVDNGQLSRFGKGIYYLPTETSLGKSLLSNDEVIQKKYIKDNNSIYGFYTGLRFLNSIGLTSQVPNIDEIVTNNEATRKRTVIITKKQIVLKKSRVKITHDNYKELQFLECINSLKEDSFQCYKSVLLSYYKKLNRKNIEKYLLQYPAKTTKYIYRLSLV